MYRTNQLQRSAPGKLVLSVAVILLLSGCSTLQNQLPPLPKVDPISPARAAATLQSDLDAQWQGVTELYPNAIRPPVTVVRLVMPSEEPAAVADCLNRAGYTGSKPTNDGGVRFGAIPDGQGSAFEVTLYSCYGMYPIDPVYNQPPNAEQTRWVYIYWSTVLTKCLRSRGVHVDDAPSFTVFEQQYGSADSWDPYVHTTVMQLPNEAQISRACPLYPADYFSAGVNKAGVNK